MQIYIFAWYTGEDLLFINLWSDPTQVNCSAGLSKMHPHCCSVGQRSWQNRTVVICSAAAQRAVSNSLCTRNAKNLAAWTSLPLKNGKHVQYMYDCEECPRMSCPRMPLVTCVTIMHFYHRNRGVTCCRVAGAVPPGLRHGYNIMPPGCCRTTSLFIAWCQPSASHSPAHV